MRFLTLLEGLPAESALVARVEAKRKERDEWREKLGAATGRDYSRPARRRVLYHGQSLGA